MECIIEHSLSVRRASSNFLIDLICVCSRLYAAHTMQIGARARARCGSTEHGCGQTTTKRADWRVCEQPRERAHRRHFLPHSLWNILCVVEDTHEAMKIECCIFVLIFESIL